MTSPTQDPRELREIALWTERYARSRTLPFLVQWLFIVLLVTFVGLLSYLTLYAYWHRDEVLQWIGIGSLGAFSLGLLVFSTSRWGGDQVWRISQWLYGREGYARSSGESSGQPWSNWILPAGVGLALYHVAGGAAIALGFLAPQWGQVLSALYLTPFLAMMILSQRLGFWAWLWPAGYAIHAMLALAGAPVQIGEPWWLLDVVLPLFGYGLISIMVGHAYSRYALRRLKAHARAGLGDSDSDTEPENS
jgi:hypothetical protein